MLCYDQTPPHSLPSFPDGYTLPPRPTCPDAAMYPPLKVKADGTQGEPVKAWILVEPAEQDLLNTGFKNMFTGGEIVVQGDEIDGGVTSREGMDVLEFSTSLAGMVRGLGLQRKVIAIIGMDDSVTKQSLPVNFPGRDYAPIFSLMQAEFEPVRKYIMHACKNYVYSADANHQYTTSPQYGEMLAASIDFELFVASSESNQNIWSRGLTRAMNGSRLAQSSVALGGNSSSMLGGVGEFTFKIVKSLLEPDKTFSGYNQVGDLIRPADIGYDDPASPVHFDVKCVGFKAPDLRSNTPKKWTLRISVGNSSLPLRGYKFKTAKKAAHYPRNSNQLRDGTRPTVIPAVALGARPQFTIPILIWGATAR